MNRYLSLYHAAFAFRPQGVPDRFLLALARAVPLPTKGVR